MKIKVSPEMRHYVPGYVFQQGPFVPVFREAGADVETQQRQLKRPVLVKSVTIVGDTFVDPKVGRYFATYLAGQINSCSEARPLYVYCDDAEPDEWTSVVAASELRREDRPCALIISMGMSSTPAQLERARDIMAKWSVPAIIQCSGVSPIATARKLFVPCHRPFYLTGLRPVEI